MNLGPELNDKFRQFLEQYYNGTILTEESGVLENFLRKEFLYTSSRINHFAELSPEFQRVFNLSDSNVVDSSIPFLLIEDLIEIGSFDVLAELLAFLLDKTHVWGNTLSSRKGNGLILLRSLNHLRKKIVRSEQSVLAGLSLLLLSRIFPVNERSGLNLKGERNLENTNLSQLKTLPETNQKLQLFWSVHRLFFNCPNWFNEKDNWEFMENAVNCVLLTIEKRIKLEDAAQITQLSELFLPHNIIDEQNFDLQVADSGFRLSLLLQILVLLQDLNVASSEQIKSKLELNLSEAQCSWINESCKKAFYLVSMHHQGKEYFRFFRFILRNEKNWILWKNQNCPEFVFLPAHIFISNKEEDFSCVDSAKMGCKELHRLWKCSLESIEQRNLKPDAGSYLESFATEDENVDSVTIVMFFSSLFFRTLHGVQNG